MALVHATADTFEALIRENKIVLVDFFATWCGPCRMIAPLIEQVAEEYDGKAVVAKVDIDEEQELATQYGIESIPTGDPVQGRRADQRGGRRAPEGFLCEPDRHAPVRETQCIHLSGRPSITKPIKWG